MFQIKSLKFSLICTVLFSLIFSGLYGQKLEEQNTVHSIPGIARNQIELILSGQQTIQSALPLIETLHIQNPSLGFQVVSELLLSEHCKKYTQDWAILLYYKSKYELEYFFNNEELELLEENVKECIVFFKDKREPFWLAKCYSLLSNIRFNISFNNDDVHFEEALKFNAIAQELMLEYQSDIQKAYSILGEIYRIKGNIGLQKMNYSMDSVLVNYDTALEYFSLNKDKSGQAKALLNKAIMFSRIERDTFIEQLQEDPINYFEKAINVSTQVNDILSARQEFAIYLQEKFKTTKDKIWNEKSNEQLLEIIEISEDHKADAYFQLAMNMQNFLSYSSSDLSEMEQKELMDSTVYFYEKTLISCKDENNLKVYNELFYRLSVACPYFSIEQCSSLLRTLNEVKTHFIQKNKMINQEITNRNEKFRIAIETQKRKSLIQQGVIIFLVLSVLVGGIFYQTKNRSLKREIAIKQEALRAQMNPHFISNSINAIESLVNQERNDEASEYLIDFSRLCRMVINQSRDDKISLKEEVETLGYFLSLEELRLTDDLDYSISIDNQLDSDNIMVPPLLLQPFVENAIWHGIKNKPEPKRGEVKIEVTKKSDKIIEYTIEDNGVGRVVAMAIQKASIIDQKSWGMTLTKERLQYLKKDHCAGLEIIDLYDKQQKAIGTKVKIQLPIIRKKK